MYEIGQRHPLCVGEPFHVNSLQSRPVPVNVNQRQPLLATVMGSLCPVWQNMLVFFDNDNGIV
eukprot:m.43574 g.43574  ORF g.43574 m.43574 type:complete len:63 (-) comp10784_c0_seq1:164-352(-)